MYPAVNFLFEVSNNMVSGDDSAKNGIQLSLIEESYINKESEKQLRCRYDHFIYWRALARQQPILYNSEKKAVDCVFYIWAFWGACDCTWKY